MANDPPFSEDRYFLEAGSERREALRTRLGLEAKRLHDRDAIASALSLDDPELVERIHALGFDGDSVRVLDVLPLVHVAWADGRVQRKERASILGLLEKRGIAPGSGASVLIETLLEKRPSDTFLAESLAILQALTRGQEHEARTVVDLCLQVADASGGLFGLGERTDAAERAVIERVIAALGDAAAERFRESWAARDASSE